MQSSSRLDRITKAYDVRGRVGMELDEDIACALGFGFAKELLAERVVVGYDMRESSPVLARAFSLGVNRAGASVVDIGLCSTDMSYFASGSLNLPAAMFTASHNPAEYNGIKLSRPGALGISLETGLAAVRESAKAYLDNPRSSSGIEQIETRDILPDYVRYMRSLARIPAALNRRRSLRVVVDAGNGMAGLSVPAVLGSAAGLDPLPVEVIPMYFELDGTFPNHEANPLDPANLVDLQRRVRETEADLGLAFDGDADRCFVVDELGFPATPSAIGSLVARQEVSRALRAGARPDSLTVAYSLLTSKAFEQMLRSLGVNCQKTRVGHSLIKEVMRRSGAIFGCEHSAHYYFRDFFGADNGLLAALHVLAELLGSDKSMSELAAQNTPYFASGEINSPAEDVELVSERVRSRLPHEQMERLDGLTLAGRRNGQFWWLNLRPSNTEPLLRLNVEAESQELMEAVRDRVLSLIRA